MMKDKKLIRIVRMTFRKDEVEHFLDLYRKSHQRIRDFKGCLHLELWQDYHNDHIFTSYSEWVDEEALEAYRHSEVFREIWKGTKRFFAGRPEAHSFRKMPEF